MTSALLSAVLIVCVNLLLPEPEAVVQGRVSE